jgi:hypothetical protein
MANTKAKIFIGLGIATFVGVGTFLVFNHFKKKRIMRDIYSKLLDTTSQESQQAQLGKSDKLKGTDALNPAFWQSGKADVNKLITGAKARELADELNDWIGKFGTGNASVMPIIRKIKTRGQGSQVAYAYANPPKSYGDLANDLNDELTGIFDSEASYKQVLNYLNNLPA